MTKRDRNMTEQQSAQAHGGPPARSAPSCRDASARLARLAALLVAAMLLAGCASGSGFPRAELEPLDRTGWGPLYKIGSGDQIQIFVWDNPELSVSVPVRPDGRINTPLVEDLEAAGKNPTELARELEEELARYVQNPVVTVIVSGFNGQPDDQIRVVGEAAQPQALLYRERMTVLDVMIAVGGLTEFAAGNRAQLIREIDGERRQQRVRLDDLVRGGDIEADVAVRAGDILIIPEAWF